MHTLSPEGTPGGEAAPDVTDTMNRLKRLRPFSLEAGLDGGGSPMAEPEQRRSEDRPRSRTHQSKEGSGSSGATAGGVGGLTQAPLAKASTAIAAAATSPPPAPALNSAGACR